MISEKESPRSAGVQYATGEEWTKMKKKSKPYKDNRLDLAHGLYFANTWFTTTNKYFIAYYMLVIASQLLWFYVFHSKA